MGSPSPGFVVQGGGIGERASGTVPPGDPLSQRAKGGAAKGEHVSAPVSPCFVGTKYSALGMRMREHPGTRVLYPQSSGGLNDNQTPLNTSPRSSNGVPMGGGKAVPTNCVWPRNIAQGCFPSPPRQWAKRSCGQIGGHGDCSNFLVLAGRWSRLSLRVSRKSGEIGAGGRGGQGGLWRRRRRMVHGDGLVPGAA